MKLAKQDSDSGLQIHHPVTLFAALSTSQRSPRHLSGTKWRWGGVKETPQGIRWWSVECSLGVRVVIWAARGGGNGEACLTLAVCTICRILEHIIRMSSSLWNEKRKDLNLKSMLAKSRGQGLLWLTAQGFRGQRPFPCAKSTLLLPSCSQLCLSLAPSRRPAPIFGPLPAQPLLTDESDLLSLMM